MRKECGTEWRIKNILLLSTLFYKNNKVHMHLLKALSGMNRYA